MCSLTMDRRQRSPSRLLSKFFTSSLRDTNCTVQQCQYRKETGLDRFVPASLAESMKRKELRKLLTHFLKLNATSISQQQQGQAAGTTSGTTAKTLTALQAKLHYLKIIADLPSYGAKCFSTNVSVSTDAFPQPRQTLGLARTWQLVRQL